MILDSSWALSVSNLIRIDWKRDETLNPKFPPTGIEGLIKCDSKWYIWKSLSYPNFFKEKP